MLNQLVNAWNGGLTEFAVYFLRLIFTPLLIYNLVWSFRGCVNFMRKHQPVVSMLKSMIFFFTAGIAIRQFLFFTGYPNESVGPVALTALCLMMMGSILAAVTHRYNLAAKLSTFYWLVHHKNVDVAVRAAELARLDKEYMEGVLESAETNVAVRLAKRALTQ